jgi:flagella basal body P-ring formation protein FlgA
MVMPRRLLLVVMVAAATLGIRSVARADQDPSAHGRSADEVVRDAVRARLGAGVDVDILQIGITGSARVFRDARPDPSARLGRPIRFTLVTTDGGLLPVSVVLAVTGERVVALRAIDRGAVVSAADIETVRGVLADVPLRRLPGAGDLAGGKALRPIAGGVTVLPGFVAARRAVEPGDQVTATAAGGAVQVTAEFTAADGGAIGDVIRVVNPATRRYVRGRIVRKGFVEVINGR